MRPQMGSVPNQFRDLFDMAMYFQAMQTCEWCRLVQTEIPGGLHRVSDGWTLNGAVGATTRPWLVLQTARHVADTADLTASESAELGPLIQACAKRLQAIDGVDRVYSLLMNDNPTPHVHVHITVALERDSQEARGAKLLGTPAPDGIQLPSSAQLAMEVAQVLEELDVSSNQPASEVPRENYEPSPLVRTIVSVANRINRFPLWPSNLARRFVRRLNGDPSIVPDWYFPLWASFLCLAVFLTPALPSTASKVISGLALLRLIHMASVHIAILLDRRANRFKSFERSVALLGVNFIELALTMALSWQAFFGYTLVASIQAGVSTAIMNATFSGSDPWALALNVGGTAVSALLLVGAIGTMLGRLASVPSSENVD